MKAELIKIKSAMKPGTYQRTSIDDAKDAATILLKACNGGSYTISSKVELKGRGITPYRTPGVYEVTERALEKLQAAYSWHPDF